MLAKLFRRKPTIPDTKQKSKYLIAQTGRELLLLGRRPSYVTKIKRSFSVTEEVWNRHYLHAIEQFAEIVQSLPASEVHHHSVPGGLLDHTLEALHAGVRIAQGYVLPPNSEPENIASSSDRWRFGAFIAILAHDLGKVVTDIEVVYKEADQAFVAWNPWYGNIPCGSEYIYRYRPRPEQMTTAKSLHEKATMSLFPKLLTRRAADWLFDDLELLSQIFNTITHSTFGGKTIAEIVRAADGASVSANLGASTGVTLSHSVAVPLHEKVIIALRKLIADGDLKRNRPGAALWVTKSETWIVSKASIEAVRVQLEEEGHKGIPKSVVRIFEVLKDHGLIKPTGQGDSVWTAEVQDNARNWRQKLTFLRFANETIWPSSQPEVFDGEITPIDKQGVPIEEEGRASENNTMQTAGPPLESNPDMQDVASKSPLSDIRDALGIQPSKAPAPLLKPTSDVADLQPRDDVVTPAVDSTVATKELDSAQAKAIWSNSRKVSQSTLEDNDFINWLVQGISRHRIRVNEPKAPVHILDHHVALVTPAVFNLYFDKQPLKKKLYESRATDKKIYTLLQRELEALDIHQRGTNGRNIIRMTVEGQRSQSELKVYLLNRECFPSLKNFSANKVMRIHL